MRRASIDSKGSFTSTLLLPPLLLPPTSLLHSLRCRSAGLLLSLLLTGILPSLAQTAAPAETTERMKRQPKPRLLPPDQATALTLRLPDAERLRELRGQREFNYLETPAEMSPWALFWAKFWQRVLGWLNQRSYTHFWRWVFYGMFIAAGTFIVLKLLQVDLTGAFGRAGRRTRLDYDTNGENIHEVDFATRLAEAEAAGNFRLAVRLGYLQLLKHLTAQGLIDWQPNKTNQTYLNELTATGPLRADFREITRQFEYVWYGELPLTTLLYAQVRAGHKAFATQLSSTPAHRAIRS